MMKFVILVCTLAAHSLLFAQSVVIPAPVSAQYPEGFFELKVDTKIFFSGNCGLEAQLLGELISSFTQQPVQVISGLPDSKSNFFFLNCRDAVRQNNDMPDFPGDLEKRITQQPDGAYQLKILRDQVLIAADQSSGIFYAVMSLKQMLLNSHEIQQNSALPRIACVSIRDQPAFSHRGLLLDCCRHFMTKDFILKYIDLLALYKMNVLHWHLTEDQGWRIQIDRYPLLTEVGAWRTEADGSVYGGFYSKSEIREIVAYAAQRHITVIPEIEMPGHSVAALAAYPHLGCTGERVQVENEWGVFKDIYCAGNDETFNFLTNVLSEVCELFPSPYIHIGGDEAPKFRWENCPKCQRRMQEVGLKNEAELQTYFIERIAAFLATKGKKIIGWDEILEGGIPADAAVQSWRGMDGGKEAAQSGHQVIMSPTSHCYFDYGLESTDLREVYGFDPIPAGLSSADKMNIRGAECNMWSEHAPQELVDGKIFPRILAMAEVLWSYPQERNYDAFALRVNAHYRMLDLLKVDYGFPEIPANIQQRTLDDGSIQVSLKPAFDGVIISSALEPGYDHKSDPRSLKYSQTLEYHITEASRLWVKSVFRGKEFPYEINRIYDPHLGAGCSITPEYEPSVYYPAGGRQALADGFLGSGAFRDGFWQGLSGQDMTATLDLGIVKDFSVLSARFFHYANAWIFRPSQVQFEISVDGKDWVSAGVIQASVSENTMGEIIVPFQLTPTKFRARFIRMKAVNNGPCPQWHDAPGEPSWLFCDEIIIR